MHQIVSMKNTVLKYPLISHVCFMFNNLCNYKHVGSLPRTGWSHIRTCWLTSEGALTRRLQPCMVCVIHSCLVSGCWAPMRPKTPHSVEGISFCCFKWCVWGGWRVAHMSAVPKEARWGCQIPWSHRGLWFEWALGTELSSFARAANALNLSRFKLLSENDGCSVHLGCLDWYC